jgi:two-component system, cell cycle sensor histidine kinase and response regulator CckA
MSEAIRTEQVKTLYRQSGPVLLTNVLNASIICATLWSSAPRSVLLTWGGSILLMTMVRLQLKRRFWQARPPDEAMPRWGRYFVIGSGTAGVLWGATGVLLFDWQNPLSQLLVTFAIGGMGAGAAGTLSCYMPAFIAYLVPSIAPLIVRTTMLGEPVYLAMSAMMVAYGFGLTFVARNTNRTISEAFRLRFENDALLERLSNAQLTLEETNRTLEQRVASRTAELERQGELLRHGQRLEAVGRLAGGIAHDFNNLLTVVMANVSLLHAERDMDDRAKTAVEEVHAAANRAAELVKQLLAFSRRQKLAPRVFDVNGVVSDVERLARRLIGENIDVEVQLGDSPLLVMADASQLEQVLMNLMANARDAMPVGGRLTVITAAVQVVDETITLPPGPYVRLTVRDTGVGMDEATRRQAFDPFFTTKQLGQGTGLGLATVYGIVEQTGGRVFLDSRPGQGSRFDIYLPRAAALRSPSSEALPAAVVSARPATILLAEDESEVRAVAERTLRTAGHTVLTAGDGEEALALARQRGGAIDLLITDVVMAKMSGPSLADELRRDRPGLPVLFISGYSWDSNIPMREHEAGIEMLDKPFTPEALSRTVTILLTGTSPAASA